MTWTGFIDYHIGTDKQVSAWLLLIAALMFLVCYLDFLLIADTPTTEDEARGYYNTFAFLLASALLLIGAVFQLLVSYPETFQRHQLKDLTQDFDNHCENFFLDAAIFFFLAYIAFYVWPCWAASDGTLGVFWAIIYIAVVIVGSVILGFLIFTTLAMNRKENNGSGSNYVWQLICYFEALLFGEGGCSDCWKPTIPFWRDHLGYDNVIAWWGVFIIAFLTVPLTLYYVILNYTNMFAYIYFMAAIVFTLAVGGIVYTSYPPHESGAVNWESDIIFSFVKPILEYLLPQDYATYEEELGKASEGAPAPTEQSPLVGKEDSSA